MFGIAVWGIFLMPILCLYVWAINTIDRPAQMSLPFDPDGDRKRRTWAVAILVFPWLVIVSLILSGCATNGDGLIPHHQGEVRGCVTYYEPGKPKREVCT